MRGSCINVMLPLARLGTAHAGLAARSRRGHARGRSLRVACRSVMSRQGWRRVGTAIRIPPPQRRRCHSLPQKGRMAWPPVRPTPCHTPCCAGWCVLSLSHPARSFDPSVLQECRPSKRHTNLQCGYIAEEPQQAPTASCGCHTIHEPSTAAHRPQKRRPDQLGRVCYTSSTNPNLARRHRHQPTRNRLCIVTQH